MSLDNILTCLVLAQIFAGLPSVLGRFIDRGTYTASKMALKEWARTPMSMVAVWHAVNFLRSYLLGTGPFATVVFEGNGVDGSLHRARRKNGTETPGKPPHRKGSATEGLDYYMPTHWVYYVRRLGLFSETCPDI